MILEKQPKMSIALYQIYSAKSPVSTLEYLVIQGIERNRLKSIGYGEMQPLSECVKEGICTEEEYDINRRCEFTILN